MLQGKICGEDGAEACEEQKPVVVRQFADEAIILKRSACVVYASLLGPMMEAAIGLVQTHPEAITEAACWRLYKVWQKSRGRDRALDPASEETSRLLRKEVLYSADRPGVDFPRAEGVHQTEGRDTRPFHDFIALCRPVVVPDGFWNILTSPRRDESVRMFEKTYLHALCVGLSGELLFSVACSSFVKLINLPPFRLIFL